MRRILFAVIGCFTVFCAHAAQIVNVDYVHKLIAQEWDISIPIKADSPMQAANMKYLLTAVDVANEILNGEKTTDYGNGEFATLQAADTVATIQAVETLVRKIDKGPEFTLTTTPDTSSFSFSISAAGEFVVDWGDGTVETITKPDTTDTTYTHNYDTANTYTIGLSGQATAYNFSKYTAAISFRVGSNTSAKETNVKKIASIDGSLGAIFGTLTRSAYNQPQFYETFSGASNITCSIPAKLFTGISGAPAEDMFRSTFSNCSGLTSIPAGLFAGISGAPAPLMFDSTFSGCSGLTSIPSDLFAGISSNPASHMFRFTFKNCSGLTSIPENLFGNISGTAQYQMFEGMFMGCTSLTGPSARINGQYLYEIWPTYPGWFYGAYIGCTGLSDYATMPTMWKTDDD